MSTDAQALAILNCPRCGAAVAVANEPYTKCAYGRAEVEVPKAYRAPSLIAVRELESRRTVSADALGGAMLTAAAKTCWPFSPFAPQAWRRSQVGRRSQMGRRSQVGRQAKSALHEYRTESRRLCRRLAFRIWCIGGLGSAG